MVRNPVCGALGVLLALSLIGARSAAAEGSKMVLTRPLKAGVAMNYKATIKASIQGMDLEINQSQKQTIKTVKDNGTVVILVEDLGGALKLNGEEHEQKPSMPTTETRDKLGKLLDLTHETDPMSTFTPEIAKLMASINDLLMTDKEVAEGDTWETLLDNPASKDNKAKVKTTYQGMDKLDGVNTWKFKQTAEAVVAADGSKMSNEATIWINPKDGMLQKVDANIKGVPTATPQLGSIDFNVVVMRVKGADDAKPAK